MVVPPQVLEVIASMAGTGGLPAPKTLVASMFPLSDFIPPMRMKSPAHSHGSGIGITVTLIALAH
jgi:hypothetical protein